MHKKTRLDLTSACAHFSGGGEKSCRDNWHAASMLSPFREGAGRWVRRKHPPEKVPHEDVPMTFTHAAVSCPLMLLQTWRDGSSFKSTCLPAVSSRKPLQEAMHIGNDQISGSMG